MTHVRLAFGGPTRALENAFPADTVYKASLLVSFVYLRQFLKSREHIHVRDWVYDSGAYSAHNSGKEINLQEFIDSYHALVASGDAPCEVFGLDVIGDYEAGLRNVEEMWRQGVPAIPTYHAGEPEDILYEIAAKYPKIALSGTGDAMGGNDRYNFFAQAMARIWPKKVHGFACVTNKILQNLPFHSVDSSSWEYGPTKYASWREYGSLRIPAGTTHFLPREVASYMRREQIAMRRWAKQMQELEALPPVTP